MLVREETYLYLPSISTREITTKIMTKDGQTIVIGGIYEKKDTEEKSKIPFLGNIPYLGYLFSYTKFILRTRSF